jgi:hypothetical protein
MTVLPVDPTQMRTIPGEVFDYRPKGCRFQPLTDRMDFSEEYLQFPNHNLILGRTILDVCMQSLA